jgi:hypothetical protein
MSEINDRLEILIPQGRLVIGHAHCPQGCDLMAPEQRIHGHPAIHVRASYRGKTGSVFLDPVYGLHENISQIEVPEREVVDFACPRCGTSLADPQITCAECAGPAFVLHLPEGSSVEACRRNGCPGHRLRIVTGEQQMQRIFDDIGMDALL